MANLLSSLKGVVAYIVVSFAILAFFIVDCATTYREFYSIMIYLANSAAFHTLCANAVIAGAIALWKTTQWLFFGPLTVGEGAALKTAASLYVSDCVVGILFSEEALVGRYSEMLVVTTVWQILHQVGRERVHSVGSMPLGVRRRKVAGLLLFSLVSVVVNMSTIVLIGHQIHQNPRKAMLLKHILIINYTQTLFTTMHVLSLLAFGAWRSGELSPSGFFIKAFWQYASAVHFIISFGYMCAKVDAPFMLMRYFLREVMSFVDTTVHLQRYLRLTRVTRGLPAATAEDLAEETRCSICYEDMLPNGKSKRLSCGHCYHADCLQQWFQSNSTCPYCRTDLLRPKRLSANAATANGEPPERARGEAREGGQQQQQPPPPPPPPQPQPQKQKQKQDGPSLSITGDPLVDDALQEALATYEGGNHHNVILAYSHYRKRKTKEAKEAAERRKASEAKHTHSSQASGDPPRAKAQEEVATEDTIVGSSKPVWLTPPERPLAASATASASASAPPASSAASSAAAAVRPASPTADASLRKEAKDAARLRAYEAYQSAVKAAERRLEAELQRIDAQADAQR